MRLRGIRRSTNVEDRRGRRGGMRGIPIGGAGGIGLGGLLLILAIGFFTDIDLTPYVSGNGGTAGAYLDEDLSPDEEQAADFTLRVLATTEDVWDRVLQEQAGMPYDPPVLVLFSGVTQSPCGGASGATGPFYCPADRKAYLDLDFFATLARRLGAKGDFAAAYVVAHEVAHHIQNEIGILSQIDLARRQMSEREANALTVRLELQADCLAGVWASHVEGLLEPGDVAEAMNAAEMIGDDRLQRQAGRVPRPDTFTHGTSAQRAGWFGRGYDSGQMGACDTFAADTL
ncbi:KPN_02809 family neutral zinc metallopeptidase [Pseudooceanicola sp.]|uniref:KPN_02809 family neutral zinc metallopeptidase n=1 Tax=Pseudooceanicola sp. TaxID=1914328 RepID=UPI00405990E3